MRLSFKHFPFDHFEVSGNEEINFSKIKCGFAGFTNASYGLAFEMMPARKFDAGNFSNCLIGIQAQLDGDLLLRCGAFCHERKIKLAETFAALTFRAAKAANLENQGRLQRKFCRQYASFMNVMIFVKFYHQGKLKPSLVWINGKKINF